MRKWFNIFAALLSSLFAVSAYLILVIILVFLTGCAPVNESQIDKAPELSEAISSSPIGPEHTPASSDSLWLPVRKNPVSVGAHDFYAILADGTLVMWGYQDDGPITEEIPYSNSIRLKDHAVNDLSSDPDVIVADCVDRYTRLIERLQISCPQIEFIIITPPPKVASSWLPDYTANRSFNNQLIGKYVEALIEMCVQEDIPYIDAYTALKDENNALPDNFCRDGFIHLNHQGAAVVVEAVESFAQGDKT